MNSMGRQDNLGALNEVIQAINSSLELNEVLRIVMDTIVRLVRAERGFLMLRDEKGLNSAQCSIGLLRFIGNVQVS